MELTTAHGNNRKIHHQAGISHENVFQAWQAQEPTDYLGD